MAENIVVDEVIGKMNHRALVAHRFANLSIVVIIVVVLSLIAFFYVTPTTISIAGTVDSQISINIDWFSKI